MSEPTRIADVKLELFSQPRLLAGVRALISNIAHRIGFDDIACGQISLAIDEALCNIINHGYQKSTDGRIWVSIWVDQTPTSRLHLVIEDEARQVDPATIQSRDLDDVRPGGLGVYLIHEIMDEVSYERRPDIGMRLTMMKLLPPSSDEPSARTETMPVQGQEPR